MRAAFQEANGYIAGALALALATLVLKLFGSHVNSTTVSLAFLLIILFIATRFGSRPAVVASLLGMIGFNFFFLPPVGTLTIADPDNWIALVAFLMTAVTAGELSARARRRAEEAEAGRREIERLYRELREAFERASEAEALRRSELLKTALLDAVTHDLRTPLTSIKASVTTLLGGKQVSLDDEGRREMLDVIDEEADRLNRFVESLVGMARIEAGQLDLQRRWGTVDEIILTALERADPLTRNHTIKIAIEDQLPVVRVDSNAVAEVVYTLLDNAAKYSPIGSRIRVSAAHGGEGMVKLSVEDEGRGVPRELRERVFDKFFRATQPAGSLLQQPLGTGMGLAIARGIVEAHKGRIWIEDSATGSGARVVLLLPLGDEEESGEPLVEEVTANKTA